MNKCPRCGYVAIWCFTGEMESNQKAVGMLYLNRLQCACEYVGPTEKHPYEAKRWSVLRWIEANDPAIRNVLTKLLVRKA